MVFNLKHCRKGLGGHDVRDAERRGAGLEAATARTGRRSKPYV